MNTVPCSMMVTAAREKQFARSALYAALFVVANWAAAVAWHPFFAGFYSDDWRLFILPPHNVYELICATRPVYAGFLFLFRLVCSDSPFLWQANTALLFLAAGCSVYALATELLRQYGVGRERCCLGAALAAAFYFVAPWAVVLGFWNTNAITLLSQVCIIGGLLAMLRGGPDGSVRVLLCGCGLLVAGFLIYEAYCPLFLPVLIFLLGTKTWPLRACVRLCVAVGAAFLVFAFIRLCLPMLLGLPGKAVTLAPLSLFLYNIKSYPRVLSDAMHPLPVGYLLCGLSAFALAAMLAGGKALRMLCVAFIAMAAGLGASSLQYAVAGYGLAGTGVMARTLATQNIYFCLFVGMVAGAFWERDRIEPPRWRQALRNVLSFTMVGILCLFLCIFGYGTARRSAEWLGLWQDQLAVLDQFPYHALQRKLTLTPPVNAILLVQIDKDSSGEIFGAGYELGGGLLWRYPALGAHLALLHNTLVARESEWRTTWDAGILGQRWCVNGSPLYSERADLVFYARVGEKHSDVRELPNGYHGGCDGISQAPK